MFTLRFLLLTKVSPLKVLKENCKIKLGSCLNKIRFSTIFHHITLCERTICSLPFRLSLNFEGDSISNIEKF